MSGTIFVSMACHQIEHRLNCFLLSYFTCRNRNEIVTHVIDALTKIIEISRINKLISLQTTAVILLKQLNVNTNAPHQTISEELKINCIKCIETAFRRATSDVVEAFYTKDNLHIIAQTLSVCDSMIAKETFRPLRCTISFILSLIPFIAFALQIYYLKSV